MALTPDHLSSFRPWLIARGYSASTVNNYVSDLDKFFKYAADFAFTFSKDTVTSYISQIADKNYSSRALASINKFCQFALDQKIISSNPLQSKSSSYDLRSMIYDLDDLITRFQTYLESHHKTPSTIKNYINDLHQFISWANSDS